MVLQDLANWAAVLGVPLTILGLIIAYRALKGQINTIDTQINTKVDKILQLKGIQINYNVRGDVLNGPRITQEYKKGVEEEREDE